MICKLLHRWFWWENFDFSICKKFPSGNYIIPFHFCATLCWDIGDLIYAAENKLIVRYCTKCKKEVL
jgi:hypothetical protein